MLTVRPDLDAYFKDGQADVFLELREVLGLRHEELEKNTEVAKWP